MSAAPPLCLPPRPIAGTPAQPLLPPGACDTHIHVFGPPERYPLVPGRNYTPRPAALDAYLPVMEALGIARAVLVQPSVYGTDNAALLDALGRMPDRLRGVVVVPPTITDGEIAALHARGVRGIRVNRRNPGGLSLDDLAVLARRIARFGWHIQLQAVIGDGPALAPVVRDAPVPVVLDHMGFLSPALPREEGPFAELLALLAEGNLWVKLSAPYRLAPLEDGAYGRLLPFVSALVACRADRLLWATDWPHPERFDFVPDDLDPAQFLGLDHADAATRRRIFVDNPAVLYGF
ncbi:amidohydrolase family protein [Xanthobacter tagetidis]|uniref:amidohydrolase family protein n=1 Tax=Xanthobacter tagetidis TaxID=60216 RepID=UPI0014731793|nr:amidohydrolase family protein [Xanthobacter tagetidis]MBB6310290.1 putative TIM-barrel fold metal-dependent hydrolase [Xanthobacter tagetidis]